ncbi:hypothetical protein TcasGA2_TC031819 [Tribolium castaneum]|uniref:Uncharacterized protein n=1 Tax=Tribolium castaneum TaxID=7070 RepID=A0A139WPU6_TRICA|nr:hypothetical protein TcasGA2_TC031819 [Tribolium castaneum]
MLVSSWSMTNISVTCKLKKAPTNAYNVIDIIPVAGIGHSIILTR